jgi:TetR/AcrR family transcriptional regulator of autoinduction and epiphytic fitness
MPENSSKKDDILCAAMQTFAECGFEPATMENIASRACVSKRTLYKYFSNKDELFDAIIEVLISQAEQAGALHYSSEINIEVQLRGFCEAKLQTMCSPCHIKLARIVLSQCISSKEKADRLMHKLESYEDDLARWIDAAVLDKKLHVSNSQLAADHFIGALKSNVFWPQLFIWQDAPSAVDCAENINTCVENFLKAYAL